MPRRNRRSILAACAALSTTGALASIGSTAAEGSTGVPKTASRVAVNGDPAGWSSARGNAANSRYLPLEDEFPKPDTVAWRYDRSGEIAVVDGTVYVWVDNGIHALDAETGDVRWKREAIGAVGTPAVVDETVYVGGDRLTVLDAADGSTRWEREFENTDRVPDPTVAFDTVYVVGDGTLHALDAADGTVRWTRESIHVEPDDREPADVPFLAKPVAVANESVYALLKTSWGNSSGAVGAVDAATGDVRWGAHVSERASGKITATANQVFLNGAYTYLALDSETGEELSMDHTLQAATDDANVRTEMSERQEALRVYDSDGAELWNVSSEHRPWTSPIIAGDTLIVGFFPEFSGSFPEEYPVDSVVGVNLDDGNVKWAVEEGSDYSLYGSYAVDSETLYVQRSNELIALRPSRDDGNQNDGDGDDQSDESDEPNDDTESGEDEPDDEDNSSSEDGSDGEGGGNDEKSDCECEAKDGGDAGNESNEASGDDENGNSSNAGDDDTGSNNVSNEVSEDDEMPGFTGGGGLLGAGAVLEWLRRKASVDQSTDVNEPAE